jgi:arsenate reductase
MSRRPFNVLFLCTGNSARSIIAESLLNEMAQGRFKAFSAGSHPGGTVNPLVLEFLEEKGVSTLGARSKSWEEFSRPGAPEMDLVITVCGQAAGEACPVWPGHPATAHWGVEDPAAHMDNPAKARKLIDDAFRILRARIALLLSLPMEKLDRLALESKTREIGQRK